MPHLARLPFLCHPCRLKEEAEQRERGAHGLYFKRKLWKRSAERGERAVLTATELENAREETLWIHNVFLHKLFKCCWHGRQGYFVVIINDVACLITHLAGIHDLAVTKTIRFSHFHAPHIFVTELLL